MNRERKKLKKFAKKVWNHKYPFIDKRPHKVSSGYVVFDERGCGDGYYETLEEARGWLELYKRNDVKNGTEHQYCIGRETTVMEIIEVDED